MHVYAVINSKAGTAVNLVPETFGKEIERELRAAGHDITFCFAEPADVEGKLADAVLSGADAILVGGGDGTVRSAAQRLSGTNVALGILPLGTVNRLARDLKIPLAPEVCFVAAGQRNFRALG